MPGLKLGELCRKIETLTWRLTLTEPLLIFLVVFNLRPEDHLPCLRRCGLELSDLRTKIVDDSHLAFQRLDPGQLLRIVDRHLPMAFNGRCDSLLDDLLTGLRRRSLELCNLHTKIIDHSHFPF